ncbi:MAG: oligoendopeptidase F [Lachnospiraceae bacterium]
MAAVEKKREEIEEQYKWDLSAAFADDAAWEKEFEEFSGTLGQFAAYPGTLKEGVAQVKKYLDASFQEECRFERLMQYAFLRKTEDSRQEKAQSMVNRITAKAAEFMALESFFEPELLSLDEETIKAYVNSEELKEYKFMLEKILSEKEHTLSEKEEKILAGMAELEEAPKTISEYLTDADMKFQPITDENGQSIALTQANYIQMQMSNNRDVRKESFQKYYEGFRSHINTLTATYSASVKKDVFVARTRNYESARAMSMGKEHIPEYVYDNIVSAVHEYMPAMYRYVAFRKKVLGVDELHYYDVYAPLMPECTLSYTYEQAKKMVLKAVEPLGEDYVKILKQGYEERWVDAYPNEGKPAGAFSMDAYMTKPYISMNFTGTLDSVSTLAHESGHSMHSYFAIQEQPYQYAGYELFVAEVASTVNENLLIEQLLKDETDPKVRLYLLNQYLENFKGTVYRQTMFAEFEQKAHEMEENGEALSTKALCQLYQGLVQEYFGDELVMDDEVQYEWARIPHFYRAFYVYKYATGYSSAVALSEKILNEGEKAVKPYLEFLSMGGSKYPLDELKHAGVDWSTPKPAQAALQKFERILDEAEKCYEQIQKEK